MNSRSKAKIAIVASGQLCRAPRVLKEARTLAGAGYAVTVVMVANLARHENRDAELLEGAAFRKIVVDHLSHRALARLRALFDRARTWTARRAVRWGIESPHAFGPFASLYSLAKQTEADLTIVHNELGLCVGRKLLGEGHLVAADFEDWYSRDLLPEAQASRPHELLAQAEQALVRDSAYASTTSLALADALRRTYGANQPIVIRNTFPLQPAPPPLPRSAKPSFFWFSQTIGPGRGLEEFLAAWAQTTEASRLVLLGDVSPEYRQALSNRIGQQHRSDLEFHPLTSPDLLPAKIAEHDIGLALEPSEPANKDLTISNKILQYLNAGLAVLATPTSGQREVLRSAAGAGCEIDLSSPSKLAQLLDELLADHARLRAMGAAARAAAENTFSWSRDERNLLNAVASALTSRTAPRPEAIHANDRGLL